VLKDKKDEDERAITADYCFDCGMNALADSLRCIPFTMEVPHCPEYTADELFDHGAAINYTAELIDFPPHKE